MNERGAAKRIIVLLNQQTLLAYDGEKLVYEFPCVTGDSKHRTPRGQYRILRKRLVYTSKTYNVPMNYAMFFHAGYAIHEAYIDPKSNFPYLSSRISSLGATAASYIKWSGADRQAGMDFGSHGCVRLSHANAHTLFDWSEEGTPVEIR